MTKSKELRQYAKDVLPNYKNEKHKIVIKPIKIGTRHGIMYCFGCKDFTHNFRPQEIKMTKKKKKKYWEKNQTVFLVGQTSQGF